MTDGRRTDDDDDSGAAAARHIYSRLAEAMDIALTRAATRIEAEGD